MSKTKKLQGLELTSLEWFYYWAAYFKMTAYVVSFREKTFNKWKMRENCSCITRKWMDETRAAAKKCRAWKFLTSVRRGLTVLCRMDPRPPTAPTPLGWSRRFPPDPDFSLPLTVVRLGDPWLLMPVMGVDLRFSFLLFLCCSSSLSRPLGLGLLLLEDDELSNEVLALLLLRSYDEGTWSRSRFSMDRELRLASIERDWK